MAKTTKTQYCYTLKTAVKTPDIEDKAIISDKIEADSYYLQCLYKYED